MIKVVKGDILNAPENVVLHQVNCQGVMGSGLAKQIKDKYPIVYEEYKKYCDSFPNKLHLLGLAQFVEIGNESIKFFVNIFGQFNYGTHQKQTDYVALRQGFETVFNTVNNIYLKDYKLTIAIPYKIGCGLGGGNWNIVYGMIEEVFGNYDVTIYNNEEVI